LTFSINKIYSIADSIKEETLLKDELQDEIVEYDDALPTDCGGWVDEEEQLGSPPEVQEQPLSCDVEVEDKVIYYFTY
jgi:hypothetical protein